MDKISIYVRNEEKIYVEILDEIMFFDKKNLDEVLEHLIEEGEIKSGAYVDFILHFQYYSEKIKKFENNKIREIKNTIKKHKLRLKKISLDLFCVFHGCKEVDSEILIIGENESRILKITDKKIREIEPNAFNIEDFQSENFDFGDMTVVGISEADIKNIFTWSKKGRENYLNINLNLSKKDMLILLGIFFTAFVFSSLFNGYNLDQEINKQTEILDKKEDELTKFEDIDAESYTEELKLFEEIDNELSRKDFYSFVLNLLKLSFYDINYNKITYENETWKIQGNTEDYNNLIKFEEDLKKKYKNIGIEYLKDGSANETIFEYNIYDF